MGGDFLVGDHVDVEGQHAIVRFVGTTLFASGEWLGVELDVPDGKNNGTVQGEQYFECGERYGKFYRPAAARLMERPLLPPPPQPSSSSRPVRRPPSVVSPPQTPLMSGRAGAPRPLSLRVCCTLGFHSFCRDRGQLGLSLF